MPTHPKFRYGTTHFGGSAGQGTVFRINTDGTDFAIIHSFQDGSVANDGSYPMGSLTRYGSALYGITQQGGSNASGTIFKINTDGANYAIVHSFRDGNVANDGCNPNGGLTLYNSALYGTAQEGGSADRGMVFKITLDSSIYAIVHSFQDGSVANDGSWPVGSLTLSGSALYGMTREGGSSGFGSIFFLTATGMVPGAPTDVTATAGSGQATVSFNAPASTGGKPITSYTATSSPEGITKTGTASPITVTGLTDGTAYTFTVKATNAVGTGPASNPSNSVTVGTPGAPTGVKATGGTPRQRSLSLRPHQTGPLRSSPTR